MQRPTQDESIAARMAAADWRLTASLFISHGAEFTVAYRLEFAEALARVLWFVTMHEGQSTTIHKANSP